MASYDMTLPNSSGFGGGSGFLGWLSDLGHGWQNGWSNALKMATDVYNFADQQAVRPSYVQSLIGNNAVRNAQNQSIYQDLYDKNYAYTAGKLYGQKQPLDNILGNRQPQDVNNQLTQVTPPITANPPQPQLTLDGLKQFLGGYGVTTSDQLNQFLQGKTW